MKPLPVSIPVLPDALELGEEECCVWDPLTDEEMVLGREIQCELSEVEFSRLRPHIEWCDGIYFLVTARAGFDSLLNEKGQPVRIGIGPSGGFKWILFKDGSKWGWKGFREDAKTWAAGSPRRIEQCDKDGNPLRSPARAMGSRR